VKQLIGISHNLFLSKKKELLVETIMMIQEPKWELIDGQPVKRNKLKQIRFINKAETASKMFSDYAEEIHLAILEDKAEREKLNK